MPHHTIGKTIIIHRDEFAYISHPSITRLRSGEWLAAFNHSRRRDPKMHPPNDPLFRTLLSRSADDGETWDTPYFAPDFDWYGTECPGIAELSDGTVVLTQYRFRWYPLGLAAKRRSQGERIALCTESTDWTEDFSDRDWEHSRYPWARGEDGVYAHLSSDCGHSFDRSVRIETQPYRPGYSRTGVVELSDGRIAYALTEHNPEKRYTYLVCSNDKGESWESPILIVDDSDPQIGEPDIAETASGKIFCIIRCASRRFLLGSRSIDGGQTWSTPEPTTMDGYPGHLLVLADGRLLCTYGRRKAPFGIRMNLSEDHGRTWSLDREIIVRDDLPNGDLGYPTTIEYAPGKLFCCYYGQGQDGVTCVQGTYLELGS